LALNEAARAIITLPRTKDAVNGRKAEDLVATVEDVTKGGVPISLGLTVRSFRQLSYIYYLINAPVAQLERAMDF
jgi:hypothetical protein